MIFLTLLNYFYPSSRFEKLTKLPDYLIIVSPSLTPVGEIGSRIVKVLKGVSQLITRTGLGWSRTAWQIFQSWIWLASAPSGGYQPLWSGWFCFVGGGGGGRVRLILLYHPPPPPPNCANSPSKPRHRRYWGLLGIFLWLWLHPQPCTSSFPGWRLPAHESWLVWTYRTLATVGSRVAVISYGKSFI